MAALGRPVALSLAVQAAAPKVLSSAAIIITVPGPGALKWIGSTGAYRHDVVVSRIPVEHGLRERDGVFRISRFHGLRRRRHDQRGPNCRDAGPRDLGAAGRGKRGHVPYLGGSLGPEKVGQPAAADAPELRAAVRVNRYSPTAPAMAVGTVCVPVGVFEKKYKTFGESRFQEQKPDADEKVFLSQKDREF